MKYLDLQKRIRLNLFSILEVKKNFPDESDFSLRIQLSRFVQRGLLIKIKRGLYCFDVSGLDEFDLAGRLYQPSYVSCESALNYYGIIPDIPQSVISVSLTNSKTLSNQFGNFHYLKIKKDLFWGFQRVKAARGPGYFFLAQKEKALLDYFYLRKIVSMVDLRLSLTDFDMVRYRQYKKYFPNRVQKIKLDS